jgi:predicted DNA-binding transcriptional regulator AlpA
MRLLTHWSSRTPRFAKSWRRFGSYTTRSNQPRFPSQSSSRWDRAPDEDTISLLRRLAALYPDEVIAGILNRPGRKTATGERFTANQVGSLRRYRSIPRFQPSASPPDGELVSIRKAAQMLGMNTSSIHRWLADGFIAGEQVTPGAPWQIRITEELRSRIVPQAPPEYVPMIEATAKLGVSRQTVLQRVKRGELEAMLVREGRRKGLRIKVVDQQPPLFSNQGGV